MRISARRMRRFGVTAGSAAVAIAAIVSPGTALAAPAANPAPPAPAANPAPRPVAANPAVMKAAAPAAAVPAAAVLPANLSATLANLPASLPKDFPIDAIASIAPAIIGAAVQPSGNPIGPPGSPQAFLLDQLRNLNNTPGLPDQVRTILSAVIKFLDGSGGGGVAVPNAPSDPVIQQFLYPTVGRGCIAGNLDSVASALAVSGPAKLPPPGPRPGQTGFVFTALGTAPLAAHQPASPMTVSWMNIDNGRSGQQPLTNAAHINPKGPATLSTIIDTGPGHVVATIYGSLATQPASGGPITCDFLPTVGLVNVN